MKTRTIVTGLLATVNVSSCTVLSFYPLYAEKETPIWENMDRLVLTNNRSQTFPFR